MRILLALFALRVIGQLLVALFAPSWLPPMQAWYSGLLPYPLLLLSQLALVAVMVLMLRKPPSPRLANGVRIFAALYAVGMLGRYAWFRTHEIPVLFHLVLAGFLFAYARSLSRAKTRDLR
jgi:hypothetical protein